MAADGMIIADSAHYWRGLAGLIKSPCVLKVAYGDAAHITFTSDSKGDGPISNFLSNLLIDE